MRRAIGTLALLAGLARPLAGQGPPDVTLAVRTTDGVAAEVVVRDLFTDDRFRAAMESGFPLYLEYRIELREARSLWDRTETAVTWERVVLWDPVRERYVVEDAEGTEFVGNLGALERRLSGPWRVQFELDGAGEFYVKAVLTARTLSDEDVDEVFAWLKGESDMPERSRPGFITRTARRLLVQVAPLPAMSVETRSPSFPYP